MKALRLIFILSLASCARSSGLSADKRSSSETRAVPIRATSSAKARVGGRVRHRLGGCRCGRDVPGLRLHRHGQRRRDSVQTFTRKEDVYLGVGPLTSPCQFAAFVGDGAYYFQVTDASGSKLLSTDTVSDRSVAVKSGVVALFGGGTTHPTGSHLTACGSLPVGPRARTPTPGRATRSTFVWLTPAFAFDGDPTQVDQVCGTGCFHGFHVDASLTAAFRVEDKPSCDDSFCVSGVAFSDLNGNGVRDSGEPGLDGIPVRVESASGLVLTGLTALGRILQHLRTRLGTVVSRDEPGSARVQPDRTDRRDGRFGFVARLCEGLRIRHRGLHGERSESDFPEPASAQRDRRCQVRRHQRRRHSRGWRASVGRCDDQPRTCGRSADSDDHDRGRWHVSLHQRDAGLLCLDRDGSQRVYPDGSSERRYRGDSRRRRKLARQCLRKLSRHSERKDHRPGLQRHQWKRCPGLW